MGSSSDELLLAKYARESSMRVVASPLCKAKRWFRLRRREAISWAKAKEKGGSTCNKAELGDVGDNFAAGMTGGMAFVFDPESKLENLINPNSVTWNKVEVEYWKQYLKNLVQDHAKLTRSKYSQKILYEWDVNMNSFIQVCPIEMLDKIEHPVTNKISEKKAS